MRFLVIVKASKASERGDMPSTEMLTAMGRFNQQLVDAGIMLAADGLHPSSKGARVHFGKNQTVTKGPFTNTNDLVAGYWVWRLPSLDDAIAWLKRAPFLEGDEVEIRPIFEAEDFGEQLTQELREQERRQGQKIAEYAG
ncbi:MAG: YciI family protein [Bacteroidota bacterium]|nr:YciI family protein [Bacteroidota bacterium]MDP4232100.1 YciI family protein [Bacteroidota bacterium]MDP4241192.1 YciI family protein [Bacteroidota bacterium]MDP4286584.1 YciI family protein [Bacteroidota bacterium]